MLWYSQFFDNPKIERIAKTWEEKTYPSRFLDDPVIKRKLEILESSEWGTLKSASLGLCIVDKDVCLYQLKFEMKDCITMDANRSPRPTKVTPQSNDYFEVHYPNNIVKYYQIAPLRVCVYGINSINEKESVNSFFNNWF